ncbi:hypothetical protein M406DRAFT_329495 [Cryphonectria parasitica EP155]|uniref:Mediator of RNA polymerase II transcription subunit 18 n=1 Tax=Cryphonectria parasitica (strain ATCC 38755 / EP155) TaxID=660469 RepID=A0A9P4Y258_CRYP1|nr:uncharacterized protein M406DRAFT_329495 [Cryphonectria parasitica EP155]KAF3765607.1 hypothetical protein M406DRAFT_329495 [Cryphonectria parasitica EP155]
MYELFMTAFINDADHDALVSILSGYTWDDSRQRIYRVLHFAGANPNQPKPITKRNHIYGVPPEPDIFSLGLPNTDIPPLMPSGHIDPAWKELSEILKRQSYTMTTRHLVHKDRHFGKSEPIPDNYFSVNPGALFWSEIPDPASVAGGQSLIMQRKKIELYDQLNLPLILTENDFIYKGEHIEESHDIYHRDNPVEFHLVRCYRVPAMADGGKNAPSTTLPAFDSLEMVSPGKWMLTVVSYVLDDHTPDKMQAARDALIKVKDDLAPCGITFKEIDRRHYDTQLAASRKPTSQALGMNQSLAGGAVR